MRQTFDSVLPKSRLNNLIKLPKHGLYTWTYPKQIQGQSIRSQIIHTETKILKEKDLRKEITTEKRTRYQKANIEVDNEL